MAKRVAGTEPKVHSRKRTTEIDVRRHTDGLRDAGAQVYVLVERLRNGKVILLAMSDDNEDRADAEDLWRDLTARLAEWLREAYARWSLLRIALPHEQVIALWDEVIPSVNDLEDVGVLDLIRYWSHRSDPPYWITDQETRLVVNLHWPPHPKFDAINKGLIDVYEPPPFD
jgi:hypothetical protein